MTVTFHTLYAGRLSDLAGLSNENANPSRPSPSRLRKDLEEKCNGNFCDAVIQDLRLQPSRALEHLCPVMNERRIELTAPTTPSTYNRTPDRPSPPRPAHATGRTTAPSANSAASPSTPKYPYTVMATVPLPSTSNNLKPEEKKKYTTVHGIVLDTSPLRRNPVNRKTHPFPVAEEGINGKKSRARHTTIPHGAEKKDCLF